MRPRHADISKEMDCEARVVGFRSTLSDVKTEAYPELTNESLIVTRDEAGHDGAEVRKRLNSPRLTRQFILLGRIGMMALKRL